MKYIMAKFNKINEVYKWRNSTRSNEVYKWRNSTKSMKHINEVKFHKKKKAFDAWNQYNSRTSMFLK
jgi:hypothetical protein